MMCRLLETLHRKSDTLWRNEKNLSDSGLRCKLLVEEDKAEPSDVHLWWGGEPGSDSCYAFLTLFFEFDHKDIGTPSFGKKVSRNMRALINIAEKDNTWLSSYRLYEPNILRAIFSYKKAEEGQLGDR